jgi:hypothetical protein
VSGGETAYICRHCNKSFSSKPALSGHQSHCWPDSDDATDGASKLTRDRVSEADEAELRELARVHAGDIDPDGFGSDRLKAELLSRASDTGNGPTTATDGGENA